MGTHEGQLRDELAAERTRLANERTLLAYARTALALGAGGAALLHFFPDDRALFWIAWVLMALGIGTLAIGAYRFFVVAKKLRSSTSE